MARQPLTPQNGTTLLKSIADKPLDNWQGTSPQPFSGEDLKPIAKPNLRPVEWLNFFLADVQTGLGPFLAAYLAANAWNPGSVGFVLTFGGLVNLLSNC